MTDFAVEVPAEREDDLTSFDAPADEPRAIPADRADAPVSEVTERFLRAVIAKVPLERIEELHLFAPLRQGGIETGIAVVAARAPVVVAVAAADVDALDAESESPSEIASETIIDTVSDTLAETGGEPSSETPIESSDESLTNEAIAAEQDVAPIEDVHVDSLAEPEAELAVELMHDEPSHDEHAHDEHVQGEHVQGEQVDEEPSPYADASDEASAPAPVALDSEATPDVSPTIDDVPPAPRIRHTVYTARYRLVLKGPERGRWEADVVDEADAPLLTVETVVRGVQRRAGEETEILRYSERQIARALRMDWPANSDVPPA